MAAKRTCSTEGCSKQGRYLGRVWTDGTERYLGYFCCKRERTAAQEAARSSLRRETSVRTEVRTCNDVADEFLAEYAERHKASSCITATQSLKAFRDQFGDRPIGSIARAEAKQWARTRPHGLPVVVTLFNWAIDEEVVGTNPFRKTTKRGKGRSEKAPPSVKQLEALLDACDALGDYADQMRALIVFGAYSCMRPSELFELRWSDIDLATNRIHVSRRLYRGTVDTPKNGAPKSIALTPPARDVLLRQPTRAGELVFVSKQGKRLSAPTVTQYWAVVRGRAGLDFDLYSTTKHYGVHLLFKLGLSKRAIAAQCGWSEQAVDGLLRVYGHADVAALAEVDALYERPTQAEVEAFNDWMRDGAKEEIEDGSTCPVPRHTVGMTDEDFAKWDEETVRVNLDTWREEGCSEAKIEKMMQNFTPPIRAAYYRVIDAETDARGRGPA
jgi:integrase